MVPEQLQVDEITRNRDNCRRIVQIICFSSQNLQQHFLNGKRENHHNERERDSKK